MIAIQLDLFKPFPSDLELLNEKVNIVQVTCDNVRKGLFKRYNAMEKNRLEQEEKISRLEKELEKLKRDFERHSNKKVEEIRKYQKIS